MLWSSWVDVAVELHEQEVSQQGNDCVVKSSVEAQSGFVIESESHNDVSRVDVGIVVVEAEISHYSLLQVGIALLELDEKHVAVVGGENAHVLVVSSVPSALSVDVV